MSESLMTRIARGDDAAVAKVIDQYGALVWSIARRLTHNPSDAEDAVQEIFTDVWRSAHRYDASAGTEKVFVTTIARRRLIDRMRRLSNRVPTESTDDLDELGFHTPDTAGEISVEAERAARVLATLRPEQRQVIELGLLHGLSHSEEMMQKNISVKTLKDSQKNVVTLGFIMLVVIFLFLFLGGLLYLFAGTQQVTATGDALFPAIALNRMPKMVYVIFIIALISALFPSADGAITALTSSFCIDILGMQRRNDWNDAQKKKIRQRIHLGVACLFLLFVMVYKWVDSSSMIGVILKVAAYTYGPLLGLFTFGITLTWPLCSMV